MRGLPMVLCNDRLIVSGRVEHRSDKLCRVVVVCVGLATSGSAIIHKQYTSRSCRRLRVAMAIAGDLHGFVDNQRLLIGCT